MGLHHIDERLRECCRYEKGTGSNKILLIASHERIECINQDKFHPGEAVYQTS